MSNVHVLQSRVRTPELIFYRQDGSLFTALHCQSSVGRPISIICIHHGVFRLNKVGCLR